MKLGIIVGHTSENEGALGVRPLNCHEYTWNNDFAMDIYRVARENGLDCRVFTRKEHETRRQIGDRVNDWADCAIELHWNSFDGSTSGSETLYDSDPEESKDFAQKVHDKMCEALGRDAKTDRGIKLLDSGARGWSNLDAVTCPSCLVEPIFGDNIKEAELLCANRLKYATALVEGAI